MLGLGGPRAGGHVLGSLGNRTPPGPVHALASQQGLACGEPPWSSRDGHTVLPGALGTLWVGLSLAGRRPALRAALLPSWESPGPCACVLHWDPQITLGPESCR